MPLRSRLKTSLPGLICLLPGAALADPGHLAGLAGHDHWVAGAAIGLAVLAGLSGALKGRGGEAAASDADGDGAEEAQAA